MSRKRTELLSAHRLEPHPASDLSDQCGCGHVGDHAEHLDLMLARYRHELPVFGAAKVVIHEGACDCNQCALNRSLERRW